MKDGAPLPLAGIWESWTAPDGHTTETCAILTTAANSLMAPIHDRMPVILHPAEFDLWLDRTVNDPAELTRLFLPYPADLMQEWPVSTYVNSPTHIGAECIAPVA
jgi:putative SOS response-associated peptidase YedK